MNCKYINIKKIYVPRKHLEGFNPSRVFELAESMMEGEGFKPIHIREGKGRYVLVEGVHRLEACKALGEKEIITFIVGAKIY